MCRLLFIKSDNKIELEPHLEKFAEKCKISKEYQGDGWGLASFENERWIRYRSLSPIWEDDLSQFGRKDYVFIHARSAYSNEKITISNNMPFLYKNYCFIFNGELRGVRIKESGNTGAMKLFNYLLRFHKFGFPLALQRVHSILERKTEFIRGMNYMLSNGTKTFVSSYFNQEPDYFTLYTAETIYLNIVSSIPYNVNMNWNKIENKEIMVI